MKTQIDSIQTERQLLEMRIAVTKHCESLRSVTVKLEKGDIEGATKTLRSAVDRLYAISLKHAKEHGYKAIK